MRSYSASSVSYPDRINPKCECGAKKTYGDKCKDWMHSDYCPAYRSQEECDQESRLRQEWEYQNKGYRRY